VSVTDQLSELQGAPVGLTITRVFDAPRRLLWQEWTEPERLADWLGGAEVEVPPATVSIDLVPGGLWTATTRSFGADRQEVYWHGEYVEIVEPARLAFTIQSHPGESTPDLVTVRFSDLGDGRTEITLEQRGHRTVEQYARARETWSAELDHIARRLRAGGGEPARP
jgi:uncharacterized protein YndB with AHSA1/START domain